MAGPDLSLLPDVLLVHVFQMLPLADRGRLASCCRRLSAVMNCPALWRDVTLELAVDIPLLIRIEEGIVQRDWDMIEKYGEHFRNVSVFMNSGRVESRSLKMLTTLCQRQVIKRVTLSFDSLLSKLVRMVIENPDRSFEMFRFAGRMMYLAIEKPVEPGFFDILRTDAHFTLELPPQYGHTENIARHELYDEFSDNFYTQEFYYNTPRSKKFCTLLTKLILSTNPTNEIEVAWMCPTLPAGSPPPTATLISTFPNLQELHVNIRNLSDQLLEELSSPGRGTPLRRLVIRHIDFGPKPSPDITVFPKLLRLFRPIISDSSFPQLSSAAWKQLANASPSLKVECCVVVAKQLPELSEIIRPETPLVKFTVVCGSAEEESVVRLYQDLSQNHCETLEHIELSMGSEANRLHTERMQRHWKDMVLACSRVRRLVCDLDLHPQHLEEVNNSREWITFALNTSCAITTQDRGQGLIPPPCEG